MTEMTHWDSRVARHGRQVSIGQARMSMLMESTHLQSARPVSRGSYVAAVHVQHGQHDRPAGCNLHDGNRCSNLRR